MRKIFSPQSFLSRSEAEAVTEEKTASRHREQIRALLRKHDPALLEFLDAARGVFGTSSRLTQLQLEIEPGKKLDLRKPLPDDTP